MPRVSQHVSQGRAKKAQICQRCAKPIEKGQNYYQWAIKRQYGGVVKFQHTTCGFVRESQKTESKMSGAYAAVEGAEDAIAVAESASDIAEALRTAAGDIESVRDEYQDSLDNMPEGLQQGDTGQQIQERIEALEEFAESLQGEADDIEGEELGEDEEDDPLGDLRSRAEEALGNYNW